MPRLGVTRNKEQLKSLFALADPKKLEVVPLPLTKIEPLSFDFPSQIRPDSVDWLIFTSANSVASFFMHCRNQKWQLSKNIKIAAIGDNTKKTLLAIGYNIGFLPSEAYGEKFFPEFIEQHDLSNKIILYPRAEVIVNDPTRQFENTQATFCSVICYKTVENKCSKDLVKNFSSDDYIFFTAPSSVSAYQHQFGKPVAKILAIGTTTAQAIEKNKWPVYKTLEKPEIDKVLEYI